MIEGKTRGKNVAERVYNTYVELQQRANALYDQAAMRNSEIPGLRQVLEKKEVCNNFISLIAFIATFSGPFSHEYDGQTRQFCVSIRHNTRSVFGRR